MKSNFKCFFSLLVLFMSFTCNNIHAQIVTPADTLSQFIVVLDSYNDSILNPYFRDNAYGSDVRLNAIDSLQQITGWEWVYIETPTKVSKSYPETIEYSEYTSHPGLRYMRDGCLYDENGNLIYYPMLKRSALSYYGESSPIEKWAYKMPSINNDIKISMEIIRALFADAYLKDTYNIKTTGSKDTKYALENILNISNASQKTMASQWVNMFESSVTYNTASTKSQAKKAYRKGQKASANMIAEAFRLFDTKARNWQDQVGTDNQDKFQFIPMIKRLNGTLFLIVYADTNCQGSYEVLVQFVKGKDPYTAKVGKVAIRKADGRSYHKKQKLTRPSEAGPNKNAIYNPSNL